MKTVIIYVEKDKLYPSFGMANKATRTAYVRLDLPSSVIKSVVVHELSHLADRGKSLLWSEIKANFASLVQEPIGFFYSIWLTITSIDRIKYYIERFREGK